MKSKQEIYLKIKKYQLRVLNTLTKSNPKLMMEMIAAYFTANTTINKSEAKFTERRLGITKIIRP
jgi:hypothetical protein